MVAAAAAAAVTLCARLFFVVLGAILYVYCYFYTSDEFHTHFTLALSLCWLGQIQLMCAQHRAGSKVRISAADKLLYIRVYL